VLTRSTVLARRGDVAGARGVLESIRYDESVGDEQNRAMLWSARAEVLAAESRYPEAAAAAGKAVALIDTMGLGHPAVKSGLLLETWCALRAGDREPAERTLAELADEPLTRRSPRLAAHVALLRAMLAPAAEAPAAFAEAVGLARSAAAPWYLAVSLAEQANAGIDREAALAEAGEILEGLGAAPALDRLAGPEARPAATVAG
jgi:ATP/maltotriose-dependent transcriptional regulator MalT